MTFGKIGARPLVKSWTARDYVQNGLVAMWDGIENAGWGVHNANATAWMDLVGGIEIPLTSSGAWDNDSLCRTNSNDMYRAAKADNSLKFGLTEQYVTFETVFRLTSESGDRALIASPYSKRSVAAQMSNNWFLPDGVAATSNSSLSFPITYGEKYSASTTINLSGNITKLTANGSNVTSTQRNSISYGADFFGFLGGRDNRAIAYGNVYCLRLYSRALTAAEIAANYAIDKARFNLPSA